MHAMQAMLSQCVCMLGHGQGAHTLTHHTLQGFVTNITITGLLQRTDVCAGANGSPRSPSAQPVDAGMPAPATAAAHQAALDGDCGAPAGTGPVSAAQAPATEAPFSPLGAPQPRSPPPAADGHAARLAHRPAAPPHQVAATADWSPCFKVLGDRHS